MNTREKHKKPSTGRIIKNPESISDITVELIKEVLHNKPSIDSLVSIETDTDYGRWSLLGDIARVKLKYADDKCEPKSMIVKFQKVINPEREGQVYQLLAEAKVHSMPRLFSVFDNGTIVLEGTGSELMENPDVKAAYFGV